MIVAAAAKKNKTINQSAKLVARDPRYLWCVFIICFYSRGANLVVYVISATLGCYYDVVTM